MQECEPIPLPGRALVGMNAMYSDFEGSLFIPRNARSLKMMGRVGMVCAVTPYPEGQLSWVYERGECVARHAWRHNAEYIAMLGKYAVCRQAVLLYGTLYSVRLEHLECVVPPEAKVDEDELGRCRRCKAPGGELGVLLGVDGHCPMCGYNRWGEHVTESVIDISEYELDEWVRKPMEQAHIRGTGGKAVKGRVISYPGQGVRRTPTVALDAELNDLMKHLKEKG